MRVLSTSRGKQAVTDMTEERLLLRKRTLEEMGFWGDTAYVCTLVPSYYDDEVLFNYAAIEYI